MNPGQTPPLALYVHWPFCVSKCPYCDFNSHVRASVDQTAWCNALLTDLAYEARVSSEQRLSSIFFGGGTPSLMPPATVAAVIEAAEQAWGFVPDIEITLEANPSSVEASRFVDLSAAGINRVSLGLQALDDAMLRFLGRAHDVAEGIGALTVAQKVFKRVNFDLIYARPDQRLAAWENELRRALDFGTEHLSLYQLTIEPGTRFATEAAAGRLVIPDADAAADLFEATRTITGEAGLPAYEISNHARTDAQSRHNLSYWRYTGYVGIGPGAHGRRGGQATMRHRKPENWLAAIARNGHGAQSEEALDPKAMATEALVMGLRLSEGVALNHLAARGIDVSSLLDMDRVTHLAGLGFLTYAADHLCLSDAGMPLLDAILRDITRLAD